MQEILLTNASKFSPKNSTIIVQLLVSENELIWRVIDEAEIISAELQS